MTYTRFMDSPPHEKRHRLSAASYRGRVIVAFTLVTRDYTRYFESGSCADLTATALRETFDNRHGRAGVYVIMPEHLHLIVSGTEPQDRGKHREGEATDLLALVKEFKQQTTYRFRKAGVEFGWQKDFYDHIVRANEDYGAQVRYLLRNPVRRGLCQRWEDWPHKGVLGQTWQQLAAAIATL